MVNSSNGALNQIVRQNLHCDEKSKEQDTTIVKRKYKLAGNSVLDQYFFHVLTTMLSACKAKVTLTINKGDWENIIPGAYLHGDISYCDLTKYDILDKAELLAKINDQENGFICVAKLSDPKYEKLQRLKESMVRYSYISEETRKIVMGGLSEQVDEMIKKFGL